MVLLRARLCQRPDSFLHRRRSTAEKDVPIEIVHDVYQNQHGEQAEINLPTELLFENFSVLRRHGREVRKLDGINGHLSIVDGWSKVRSGRLLVHDV